MIDLPHPTLGPCLTITLSIQHLPKGSSIESVALLSPEKVTILLEAKYRHDPDKFHQDFCRHLCQVLNLLPLGTHIWYIESIYSRIYHTFLSFSVFLAHIEESVLQSNHEAVPRETLLQYYYNF